MRTEYSYEAENIEPFCDIFYIDCFYNSLLPILKNYGVDKKVILGAYVPVICPEEKLGAMLEWKCVGDRREILNRFGIDEKAYIEEQDICESIKGHLERDELVIVYIDCFYEKGRFDTYMKEHWPHTILVYGYNELEEEFSILEHTAKENLDYAPRKISYSDLVKCYRSVVKLYGEKNKPSLYCYRNISGNMMEKSEAINPIVSYAVLKGCFEETGIAINAFKEKMFGLIEEEEYYAKIQNIIQFLTDVINSKIAFEYVMDLFGEKEFIERSKEIRNKWQSIRNTVVKNSYTNKATPAVLVKKLELLDEISEGECKLVKMLLEKEYGMETIEKVKELIKELLPAGTEIEDETLLKGVGLNSLSFIKLIVSLEDEFDIEFEDAELGKFETSTPITLTEYIESSR